MLLKDLHTRFLELLETGSSSDTSYASWKLKQKLQAYCGEKISFIETAWTYRFCLFKLSYCR